MSEAFDRYYFGNFNSSPCEEMRKHYRGQEEYINQSTGWDACKRAMSEPAPCNVPGHRECDVVRKRVPLSEIPGAILNDGASEMETWTCLRCREVADARDKVRIDFLERRGMKFKERSGDDSTYQIGDIEVRGSQLMQLQSKADGLRWKNISWRDAIDERLRGK